MFEKFNSKYDKLNEGLNEIASDRRSITDPLKYNSYPGILMDYFNLCSEQYFWYKKKRISEDVWKAWYTGMNYYYNKSKIIRDFWASEIADNGYISYYLAENDNLFNVFKEVKVIEEKE